MTDLAMLTDALHLIDDATVRFHAQGDREALDGLAAELVERARLASAAASAVR